MTPIVAMQNFIVFVLSIV